MENKKAFGSFVQQKRKEAGLTQKSFAEKIYVTESAVSKWERGLSYPDISLLKAICDTLGVSERELLTASEDTTARTNEKTAQRYRKLMQFLKWTQFILYGAVLIICFICNLAIQHTLSWFFIVLGAVMTAASLTLLPLLIRTNKRLATLGGFTLSVLFLLFVCSIYSKGDWFVVAAVSVLLGFSILFLPMVLQRVWLPEPLLNHKGLIWMCADTFLLLVLVFITGKSWFFMKGLPITAFWLIIPWGIFLLIRYVKMNGFFKSASCLTLVNIIFCLSKGVMDSIIFQEPIRYFPEFDLSNWNIHTLDGNLRITILLVSLALTTGFVIAGILMEVHKKKAKMEIQ